MAYTTIDNPELFFQTKLYTGNGSTNAITLDGSENMKPDWVWLKYRSSADSHALYDSVRGTQKLIQTDRTNGEITQTNGLSTFGSDGFTIGDNGQINTSSGTYVSWNWKAGGSAPAITYSVKVVSDGGNKYRFDDFGTSAVTLDLQEGGTYTFDLSDSSNDGHPMKFSETSNGSHGGGSTYSTGVVYQLDGASVTEANYYNTSNFNSASSRKIIITVAASAPTLYYFCHYHSGMGGQANTNSTFGSSNFSGSIQSTVSANTTAGFSICTFTNPSSTANFTFGHGLGVAPRMFIMKGLNTSNWQVYHESMGNTNMIQLNYTNAKSSAANWWGSTSPTSSVCTVGADFVEPNQTSVAYVLAEKKGYSKFSSYVGNGSSSGPMIVTGFKVAWLLFKGNNTSNWQLWDNKRDTINPVKRALHPDITNTASTDQDIDFLSNGFKIRGSAAHINGSGVSFFYMAFAESPFVNSNGVPTNAR